MILSPDIAIADVPEPADDLFRPGNETPPRLEAPVHRAIDRSWGIASFSRIDCGRDGSAR
jgi:hypothetical protein